MLIKKTRLDLIHIWVYTRVWNNKMFLIWTIKIVVMYLFCFKFDCISLYVRLSRPFNLKPRYTSIHSVRKALELTDVSSCVARDIFSAKQDGWIITILSFSTPCFNQQSNKAMNTSTVTEAETSANTSTFLIWCTKKYHDFLTLLTLF